MVNYVCELCGRIDELETNDEVYVKKFIHKSLIKNEMIIPPHVIIYSKMFDADIVRKVFRLSDKTGCAEEKSLDDKINVKIKKLKPEQLLLNLNEQIDEYSIKVKILLDYLSIKNYKVPGPELNVIKSMINEFNDMLTTSSMEKERLEKQFTKRKIKKKRIKK